MSLIKRLKDFLGMAGEKVKIGKVVDMREHQTWGDRIAWFSSYRDTMVGWMDPVPDVGDLVICDMQSGFRAFYQITQLRRERNPEDMFFATVKFHSYVDTPEKGD